MNINTPKSTGNLYSGGGGGIAPTSPLHLPKCQSTTSITSCACGGPTPTPTATVVPNGNTYFFNSNEPTPTKSNRQQKRRSSDNTTDSRARRPPSSTRSQQHQTRRKKNIQREYNLLKHQLLLTITLTLIGFILFLLFTLSAPALIGLTILITSLGAVCIIATSAIKTRYYIELNEHPLGLIRYLPEVIRNHLVEKSLHECLSPCGSMTSLNSQYVYSSKGSLTTLTSSQGNFSSRGSLNSLNSVGGGGKQQQEGSGKGNTSGSSRHRRKRIV